MTRSLFDEMKALLPFVWDFSDDYEPVRKNIRTCTPQLNILESEKEYILQVAAPGMTKEDVQVKLDEDDYLVISIQKQSSTEEKSEAAEATSESKEVAEVDEKPVRYLRREFMHQSFLQKFSLPEDVDKEGIKGNMENGVLEVVLPKVKPEKVDPVERMISIE